MGKVFRSVSKSAVLGLTVASLVSLAPRPAFAQWAVYDADWAGWFTDYNASFTALMTFLGTAIKGIPGAPPMVAQPGTLVQIDNDIQQLAATITNNATTQSSVAAKAVDATGKNDFVMEQNKGQAKEMVDAAGGSLGFQRNNLCQHATLQGGYSSMKNARLIELASYNGYFGSKYSPTLSGSGAGSNQAGGPIGGGTGSNQGVYTGLGSGTACTTCGGDKGPAGVIGYEVMNTPLLTRVQNLAKTASAFFGAAEGGDDNATWSDSNNKSGLTMTDNNTPTAHLDIDPLDLGMTIPTYTDTERAAHDQLSNYLVGLPPDVVSNAGTFKSGPQFASAIVASRERLAFANLSSVALDMERAYHDGVVTGAKDSVVQIFKGANLTDPSWNGAVSEAAMDEAMYEEPAHDPNYTVNFVSQNSKTLLEFIADEMLLLNKMEYKRYRQEAEMWKVQSAMLNLQSRNFNFTQTP